MPPLLRPLRDPAMALLWGGLAASAIGDQLFVVALSWVAVAAFGAAAGYLVAFQAAMTLAVALLAGGRADRHDPLRVMVGADLARAAAVAVAVGAWLASGAPSAWGLGMAVLALAAGEALFRPALQAALPPLAPDAAMLPAVNALLDTTQRIARLLGPGLISLASLVLLPMHLVAIDGATFLVSAAAVAAVLRLRPARRSSTAPGRPAWRAAAQGFAASWRHPILGDFLLVTAPVNGGWYAVLFLGLPLVLERAGLGLASYGTVIASYGAANLLGTLVVGNLALPRRPAWLLYGGEAWVGVWLTAMGPVAAWCPQHWLVAELSACAALAALGGPLPDVTSATLRQRLLASADLAAAVRAYLVVGQAGILVALLGAPALVRGIGLPGAVAVCGLVVALPPAVGLFRHRHRTIDATARPSGAPIRA